MTQEEKEIINYKIEAKSKARNKELAEWNLAIFLGYIIIGVIALILNAL